jgi:uncharacterized protein (TIGR02246 family)
MLGSMLVSARCILRRYGHWAMLSAWTAAAQLSMVQGAEVGPARDLKQIKAFGDLWAEHYAAGDTDALADLYEPDAWLMTRAQPALKDRDAILEFLDSATAAGARVRMTFENEDIRIEGDLAFLIAKWWLEVLPANGGELVRDAGRSFLVFRRGGDGKWRIWRDIDNRAADVQVAERPEN